MERPRPVPRSFLVVKKGSKILDRMGAGMPGPLSATVTCASSAAHRTLDAKNAIFRQGVDGVGDEIGEHLEHIAGVDFSGDIRGKALTQIDLLGGDFSLMHPQSRFGESGDGDRLTSFRRPIEAECLSGKLRKGDELLLEHGAEHAHLGRVICFLLNEIVEIMDGFEGAVDLVHDGCCKLARDDKFLIAGEVPPVRPALGWCFHH